jgi:hypothetical protein
MLKTCTLPEVCAEQWRVSVERAEQGLNTLPANHRHTIRYEDFVHRPIDEFQRILEFLEVQATHDQVRAYLTGISPNSVGNWRSQLDVDAAIVVAGRLRSTLEKWGYLRRDADVASDHLSHVA